MRPDRTSPSLPRMPHGDRGDVILSWLTKVVGLLALVGLMGFDAVSLGTAQFTTEDRAQQAVRQAAESYAADKDLQRAYEAALREVLPLGDDIDPASFGLTPDGRVSLTLTHETQTLLVERIPPLRQYATVDVTATGPRPS